MFWFEGLLSLPGIGIRLKPSFKEVSAFENSLGYFLDYLSEEYDDLIINKKKMWGYSISSKNSNFAFAIDRKNIVIHSVYSITQESQPGKPPKFVIPEIRTCSELVEKIFEYLKNIFEAIKDVKEFKYDRIGIFIETNLDEESLPPGIVSWIENLGKIFLKGEVITTSSTYTIKLNKADEYLDQCHHFIDFDQSSPESGYHLKLDWQRIYDTPVSLEYKKVLHAIAGCKEEAFTYFQKFGEGDFYDD